jgi:tyrosyl-tRNA synthetase
MGQAAQSISSAVASSVTSAFESRDINEFFNPRECNLSLDERYNICESVGEEILKEEELRALLERKDMFRCYDGFEPSGRMHIA